MDLDVQSYSLGHLGIVAGIFDTLKIGEVIDEVMPKQGSKNLPHSTIVKQRTPQQAAEHVRAVCNQSKSSRFICL